jgi:hypothetical protein
MSTKTQPTKGQAMKSLWGTLPTEPTVLAPVAILKQQGQLLAKATDGLLTVETRVDHPSYLNPFGRDVSIGKIHVTMYLIATALNNYRFQVLEVIHDIEMYPALVVADESRFECADQESFEEAVAQVLQSERVRRAIAGLLAQMRSN